jgi:NAD(P)-dependent dehydrogenase (short-subunit alcohol dehydrogenase family)
LLFSSFAILPIASHRLLVPGSEKPRERHNQIQKQFYSPSPIMASKYAAAHEPANLNGPGDARPTALQIVQDEGLEGKLADKTFLITGCSSGIGVETARATSATGATVYCTARDLERGKTALHAILEPGRVELLYMDLSSLAGVRSGVGEFLSRNKGRGLNVLICNAGVMAIPTVTTTVDGYETQFATNHLAHFLLFNLLKDQLLASSTPGFNSRVVMLSSSGHRGGGIRFDDYSFQSSADSYNQWAAYSQSKTGNIYMANYIDRVFGPKGIHAMSLNPGGIWTPLQKHLNKEWLEGMAANPQVQKTIKSTEQGAATTVWAAVAKELEGKGGKYLENCQVASPVKANPSPGDPGYASHAFDVEKEDRLWKESLGMVGLKQESA